MAHSSHDCEACIVVTVAVLIFVFTPFVALPIGFEIVNRHDYVASLPKGKCFANIGFVDSTIGSISSSSKILDVPLLDENNNVLANITLRYPPPPEALNLKKQSEVRSWESSTTSPQNGVSCHYDLGTKVAWTEPIGIVGGGVAIASGFFIILLWFCACFAFRHSIYTSVLNSVFLEERTAATIQNP